MFCPQTFGTAAAKDDHVLEHFAQETCLECNRNLIRIGGSLYTKHDSSICVERTLKIEPRTVEPPTTESFATQSHTESDSKYAGNFEGDFNVPSTTSVSVKIEEEEEEEDTSDDGSMDCTEPLPNYSSDSQSNKLLKQPDYSPHVESFEVHLPHSGESGSQRNIFKDEEDIETTESLEQNDESALGQCDENELQPSENSVFCSLCGRLFNTIKERDAQHLNAP